jgi:hypothetical protein
LNAGDNRSGISLSLAYGIRHTAYGKAIAPGECRLPSVFTLHELLFDEALIVLLPSAVRRMPYAEFIHPSRGTRHGGRFDGRRGICYIPVSS